MTPSELFDEASWYRQMANEMHYFIGRNVSCTCVETPEYKEHRKAVDEAKAKLSTPEEKTLLEIYSAFDGKTLEHECERCTIMYKFEQYIGDDAVDVEVAKRMIEPTLFKFRDN